jgi:chemotaxis protein MotB
MDAKKLNDIFVRMKGSAGVLELSGYKEITNLSSFIQRYTESENDFIIDQNLLNHLIPLEGLEAKTEEIIKNYNELLEIKDDERGIVVSFQENILFGSGNVALKKEVLPVLDSIAGAIESCPNDIIIAGHADNIPVRSELYESNWELSSYRGLAVLEYFVKQKGLRPLRFTVGGYGPSRPLHPNDSPKNRALNRRVEIIFKHLQGD